MADEVDMAQARMEKEAELAMKARRPTQKTASLECVECGDRISLERQRATGGTDMCVDCASVDEQKRRQYR